MNMVFQRANGAQVLKRARAAHNAGRTIIFETTYGSRLYGCEMDGSDNDIRGVFLPGLADFLTEQNTRVQTLVPAGDLGESDDIQYFPVGTFIVQLLGMKVNSVEIFFAALAAQRRGERMHPAMELLLSHRAELLSADPGGFVGHARQRAAAYIDGEDRNDPTLLANRHVLACLEKAAAWAEFDVALRICDSQGLVDSLLQHDLVHATVNKGGEEVLMVNSRQLPKNMRIGEAILNVRQRLERFNRKANLDDPKTMFKELYTALRMMETAAELIETGEITFPCARAEFYRKVRSGEVAREEILELIDAAQARTLELVSAGRSPLRPASKDDKHVVFRDELNAELRLMALRSFDLN